MKNMTKKLLALTLFLVTSTFYANQATIRPYCQETDEHIVRSIIEQSQEYLTIPTSQDPVGEQLQYVNSSNYPTLVATIDDKAVGFVTYKLNMSHGTFSKKPYGSAMIWLLGVEQDYQGNGYGQSLLTAGLDECLRHNINSIMINVVVGNTKAENLYKKNGFSHLFTYGDNAMLWQQNPRYQPITEHIIAAWTTIAAVTGLTIYGGYKTCCKLHQYLKAVGERHFG